MSAKDPLTLAREFVATVERFATVPGMMASYDLGKLAICRALIELHERRDEQARRVARADLAEQFAAEVDTWPAEKLRRCYAQPEAVAKAEKREAQLRAARTMLSVLRLTLDKLDTMEECGAPSWLVSDVRRAVENAVQVATETGIVA